MKISLAILLLTLASTPAMAAPSLPGGASSLSEAHGDWSVGCAVQGQGDASKLACNVSQRQLDKANQRQVLAIELTPAAGTARGVLAMPLGMELDKGVVLQVDAGKSTPAQPYATCIAAGCIVPVNFDAANLKLLRTGKTLNVLAAAANGKPIKLAVPLTGLPAALDRATALLAGK
ncbi:MAG TPA: invasion associated locus B family protein [Devosiaceae bacterium]|jgi:invasion protein IalB|nr:invasion associated locus B family protein [Devosiaceae bacterium]